MRDVRRSRKRPGGSAGNRTEGGKLGPVLTEIIAVKKTRRFRSRIDTRLPVYFRASQAVHVMNGEAGVAPLPGFSAVGAGVDRAEEGARKHDATLGLEDNRADMLAAQSALR